MTGNLEFIEIASVALLPRNDRILEFHIEILGSSPSMTGNLEFLELNLEFLRINLEFLAKN